MSSDVHILNAFDRDLDAIRAMILQMGKLVLAGLRDATLALEARDEAMAAGVVKADAAIDAIELQVQEAAARLIALRAPTAGDLRTVLAVMKIASSLERCGDYVKNLGKRSGALAHLSPVEGSTGSILRMAKLVGDLLTDVLAACERRDAELAESVRQRDREVDQMYNSMFREFLSHMIEDPGSINAFMHLHFIAKNIERMGDHATGMAEQVIYLVTGSLPEDPRPKDDVTASAMESGSGH
ncbi:phosphate signaling complex protein PhoU [Cereibacter sphaeroides]|uniref:phosphate signaling complex protein PhoU n=1 Tax=Cereibacter sphaeroides TaxID=1063 RepID=UPI001F3BE449|nr:phosphate signaling complex protein PhoU [Cereibacter sphaeroides]MCE6953134.1 phosphate signaling complex protein PhoU [Cereibacter sphaeroides]